MNFDYIDNFFYSRLSTLENIEIVYPNMQETRSSDFVRVNINYQIPAERSINTKLYTISGFLSCEIFTEKGKGFKNSRDIQNEITSLFTLREEIEGITIYSMQPLINETFKNWNKNTILIYYRSNKEF